MLTQHHQSWHELHPHPNGVGHLTDGSGAWQRKAFHGHKGEQGAGNQEMRSAPPPPAHPPSYRELLLELCQALGTLLQLLHLQHMAGCP